jgi:hypothetical protein
MIGATSSADGRVLVGLQHGRLARTMDVVLDADVCGWLPSHYQE